MIYYEIFVSVATSAIGRLFADCDDGSVLTCFDTFLAAYAGIRVYYLDMLVQAKEYIDLAEYLFGASFDASPACLALLWTCGNISSS